RGIICPKFCNRPCPRNQRARGRPGARRTRGLMGDMGSECCPRAYRFGGNTPAFPAQWLYGLYEIVLVTGFLATIAGSRLSPLANLTPAPGRRTQTISPYATTRLRQRLRRAPARSSFAPLRPPLPAPRLRRWPTPLW